jgi:hypothetical protein
MTDTPGHSPKFPSRDRHAHTVVSRDESRAWSPANAGDQRHREQEVVMPEACSTGAVAATRHGKGKRETAGARSSGASENSAVERAETGV